MIPVTGEGDRSEVRNNIQCAAKKHLGLMKPREYNQWGCSCATLTVDDFQSLASRKVNAPDS